MRFDRKSIGAKLWLYFILFAAVILTLLWLMQIVFLQSFYRRMKTRDIVNIADTIVAAYGNGSLETIVDPLSFHYSLLVFMTDEQGNILYVSDEHASGGRGKPPADFTKPQDRGGPFRLLPNDFPEFMRRLAGSESGSVSYIDDEPGMFRGKYLVYGAKLPDGAALYIRTPFEAVNATTDILRTQLLYVTAIALLLSFVIAYFIAQRFSRPVSGISAQAAELARGKYDVRFDKGFCSELDGLAATLDHTARELQKVDELRRELLANISHDLRTPLTMIKAYTEMIRDISGDSREKREEHLAVICGETDRLTALVNDILELSSIQSGAREPILENVDLSALCRQVVTRFQPLAEREGYRINSILEPDQYVLADGAKLAQVLYNLIGNAVSYAGDDKAVAVHLEDLSGRVRVSVRDNGEGIAEDDLPYIWDRYYKAKSHRRPVAGTGLGLSIVKGILEIHGARFGVNSHVGEGSEFWFEMNKS